MSILLVSSFSIFCLVAFDTTFSQLRKSLVALLLVLWAAALVAAFAHSDQHYVSLWGAHGRNNGLLTYIALTMLFYTATLVSHKVISYTLKSLIATGALVTSYAVIQLLGLDPIGWENPFNPAVTTLGNPNFTAGFLGIAIASTGVLAVSSGGYRTRTAYRVFLLVCVVTVIATGSVQGIIASGAGLVITWIAHLASKDKTRAVKAFAITVVAGLFLFLSFLGLGPYGSALKQETLIIRGDYWRAAMRMLLANPIFGVGIDRYGSYFQYYRDAGAVRTGNGITADAAHNVLLHFAATGGLPLITSYVAIQAYVLRVIWRKLNAEGLSGQEYAVFAGWIAFQFQSLVSIDQIGVTVWGWLLGGVLVNASILQSHIEPSRRSRRRLDRQRKDRWKVLPVTLGLLVTWTVLILNLGRMWQADDANINFPSGKDVVQVKAAAAKYVNLRPADPFYYAVAATWLAQATDSEQALAYVDRALRMDPRMFRLWIFKAAQASKVGDVAGEIRALNTAKALDPLNLDVLLRLAHLKVATSDNRTAREYLRTLISAAPNSAQAAEAKTFLSNLKE